MFLFVYQLAVVVFVSLAFVVSRRPSSQDDAEQPLHASDIDQSQVPSSSGGGRRGRGRKVDHLHHHPEPGCKFFVSWDDDKVVQDEIGVNLNRRMYSLATNYTLFPMDVQWTDQKQEHINDAMSAIKV